MEPNEIIEVLSKIGTVLSTTEQQALSMVVRQALVTGYLMLACGGTLSILLLIAAVHIISTPIDDDSAALLFFDLLFLVGTAILTAAGILRVFNPMWYAIKILGGM